MQITPDPAAALASEAPGTALRPQLAAGSHSPSAGSSGKRGDYFCCCAWCVCPKEQNPHPKKGSAAQLSRTALPGRRRLSRRAHNAHGSSCGGGADALGDSRAQQSAELTPSCPRLAAQIGAVFSFSCLKSSGNPFHPKLPWTG